MWFGSMPRDKKIGLKNRLQAGVCCFVRPPESNMISKDICGPDIIKISLTNKTKVVIIRGLAAGRIIVSLLLKPFLGKPAQC